MEAANAEDARALAPTFTGKARRFFVFTLTVRTESVRSAGYAFRIVFCSATGIIVYGKDSYSHFFDLRNMSQ